MHSEPFGCLTKLSAKQAELVQSSCHEVASEFFATYAPDPPYWTQTDILVRFVLFGCTRDRLVALRNSEQNGPNKSKSSCHEVASEFFATNTPDTPHWTVKLRFGAFHTIWVHSRPFGCLTKLGAQRADTSAKVRATKSRQNFSQGTHPIHPIRP